MRIEVPEKFEILVLTGPECSGKTTCSERLSKKYNLPRVSEYARQYLTEFGPKYDFQDLQKITIQQLENEREAHSKHPFIICDTDIVTLEIWSREVFSRSLKIEDERATRKFYLLSYPDIPWESDPLRENPTDRLRLFDLYEEYLIANDLPYIVLKEEDRKSLTLSSNRIFRQKNEVTIPASNRQSNSNP